MPDIQFNSVEKANRDTLLGKAVGIEFDTLVTEYGYPRPAWIDQKHWRRACQVAVYGRKGTFFTLKAFLQAALAQYMVPFNYRYSQPWWDLRLISKYPQGINGNLNNNQRITHEFGESLSNPGNERHLITLTDAEVSLLFMYCHNGGLVRSLIGRDILLQGRDKQWRVHTIIYDAINKDGHLQLVLEPNTTGYSSGFPIDTWEPLENHTPFFKEKAPLNDPSPYYNEIMEPDPDFAVEKLQMHGRGFLLPFTLSEPSPGVSSSWALMDPYSFEDDGLGNRGMPRKTTEWGMLNRCRVRLNLYINEVNNKQWASPWTYLISGGDPISWALDPDGVTYQVIDDAGIYKQAFKDRWPDIAAKVTDGVFDGEQLRDGVGETRPYETEHGIKKEIGHLYGGQLLRSEFADGFPLDATGAVGSAPAPQTGAVGAHPPYFPGLGSAFINDQFMYALKFLMPVGYWLEIMEGADSYYRSVHDCDVPQVVLRRPEWGNLNFRFPPRDGQLVPAGGFGASGDVIPVVELERLWNRQEANHNRVGSGEWRNYDNVETARHVLDQRRAMNQGGGTGSSALPQIVTDTLAIRSQQRLFNSGLTIFNAMGTTRFR